jgi:hypothetical protein
MWSMLYITTVVMSPFGELMDGAPLIDPEY